MSIRVPCPPALLALALLAGTHALALAAPAPAVTVTPVVRGLYNPRGLAVDGQGSLYVAEAGQWQGSFTPAPTGDGVTSTGRVSKWNVSTGASIWSTPFSSVYDSENGPEALGPAGVAAVGHGCWKRVNGKRNGCQAYVVTSESTPGWQAAFGQTVPQLGHLFRFDRDGAATGVADVGSQQYQWTGDHAALFPPDFPDSNPYGVLVTSELRVFVADAGANTVSEILRDGTARVLAYIENGPVRDATPTCVAEGPDGALYVGTLQLVANLTGGFGQSNVYRVDPDAHEDVVTAGTHVWASGLSTVTACTFDRQGNFLATEMLEPTAGAPGDVARVRWTSSTGHGDLERLGGGSLPLPGGIAAGPDDAVYVATHTTGADHGEGEVVKLSIGG